MPTKTYTVTLGKFAQLRQDLTDAGALMMFTSPTQNTGTFNPPGHSEITLGFQFADGTLQLTILHKSFFEFADEIWNGLAPYLPQ